MWKNSSNSCNFIHLIVLNERYFNVFVLDWHDETFKDTLDLEVYLLMIISVIFLT